MALADAPAPASTSSEPDSGGIRGEEKVATKPLLSAPSPSSATTALAQESLEELDRRYAPDARRDAYGPMGLGPVGAAEAARLALRRPCSSRSGSWRASSWSPSPLVEAARRLVWGEEMAAAAVVCRRGLLLHHHKQWPPRWAGLARSISQLVKTNGRRAFLVDTLALVRKLESLGVPTKQAEMITSAITEVLNDSLESISESFVSKAEMQKGEMLQESNISKFKSQVQSSQENHFSLLQRETEKLRGDIDKMRSELKYEIDKVTAGQRLDLNLERGSKQLERKWE